ncbi:uncharacterized protein M6B38_251445 [Iris pallida]|uniref:BAG domain-containing protein n=1 Tax=Iris pallida TaxID=29817 RepID=A0AAX6IIR5_IRIPA|nr:uncharacterized protein M6B38_251445 [Iris pallida]
MENSYFRSPWNSNHTYFPQQNPHRNHQNPTPKTKFVSIPVRFVESEHSAAVRIQKLVRGFLVRKKVEVVRRMEGEVKEIERRIEGDLDLLLREEKERIRINEMLMALLLRLDSVRGARDYRKKVIRQAISMQETVDSLSSLAAKSEEAGGEDSASEYQEAQEEAAIEFQETLETHRNREFPEGTLENQESDQETGETLGNQELEVHETLGTNTDRETGETLENREEPELEFQETLENQEEAVLEFQETLLTGQEIPGSSVKTGSEVPEILENMRDETIKDQETSEEETSAGFFVVVEPMKSMKSEERTGEVQEIPVKIVVVDEKVFPTEEDGWSIVEAPEYDESGAKPAKPEKSEESASKLERTDESGPKPSKAEKENSEELGLKGLMERMLAENEKLKGLVVELCERSTLQCRLMGGIAKRVEQLESTLRTMERRKKKKRETNSA